MADIGEALTQYLLSKDAIRTVIGNRIGPDALDQGSPLPALVYFVIDSISGEDLQGAVGVAHTRVQIDAYASTRRAANALQEAVRKAPLQGFRGNMSGVFVHGVSRGGSVRSTYDSPTEGSDLRRYLQSADYIISHGE